VERNLDLRYVVIGGGMSGTLAAIRLREVACRNVTLLEKARTIGGTCPRKQPCLSVQGCFLFAQLGTHLGKRFTPLL
jgi:cation diffusion facilitator CzcD-associated flavoprotein CzcO